jgi:hypothetical protein
MKRIVLLVSLVAAGLPGVAQDRVTVERLEHRITAEHDRSDKDMAHRLEDLQLTQRLSTARREKLLDALPGPESRSALIAVADLSEVLDLPPSEIPSDLPPTAAEQQQMLALASGASNPSAGQMPDFDTTANTTRFRNLKVLSTSNTSPIPVVVPVPLVLSRGTAIVTYREGRAIITQTNQAWAPGDSVKAGVESWDGLYTLLDNMLHDMDAAQPEWARWELGPTGKQAVFRFSVDRDHAHFPVRTVVDPSSKRGLNGHAGYNAEIGLDPATGTVHRFVLRAALDPGEHILRADVVVEFGSVNVDGKSFLCPFRAVTIGVSESLLGLYNVNFSDFDLHANQDIRPLTHLVDVEFTAYRPGQSKAPAVADPAFLKAAIQTTGERLTVEQLEETVLGLCSGNDHDIAERLGQPELTQRLTAERYARLGHLLTGKASAHALLALYDLSAFADLPPSDLAPGNPPDPKLQGQIIIRAAQFVSQVTHKMPDLFATRELTRFEDLQVVRGVQQTLLAKVQPLVMVDQSTGTVHFREGREVIETASKGARLNSAEMGLDTRGTFGPILGMVMTEVLNSKIGWGHWEHGPSGPLAVFRYAVPQDASHYDVRLCCYLADDGLESSFAATAGYHGELAIDPSTGAILRLVLTADLKPNVAQQVEQKRNPVLRSDILVEYGAIDIAGKPYVCPVRTVSVMTSWTLGSQGPMKRPMSKADGAKAAKKALALMEFSRVNAINEALFRDYHVFRSEIRIVSDPPEAGTVAVPKQ